MVRCRFCIDITCAGEPDNFHIEHERECMKTWDGCPEYYGLEALTHRSEGEAREYKEMADEAIKENYPDYWEELKRFRSGN